jgi:2-polyprenyl-3-methyl-5-hydroxy-6-metoxy-1,4-benzoquinol methylase
MTSELNSLLCMAARGKAAGDDYFAHMDTAASAINYIRIADLVASYKVGGTILDWGCGYGQVSWLLRRRGLDVVSCDLGQSPGVRNIPELRSQQVDYLDHPFKLPYQTGRFDAVLSVGVLEHVDNFDASLEEIKKVLRPSGLFFVFMLPNSYSWAEKIADFRHISVHPYKFNFRTATELLRRHGFTVKRRWRRNVMPRNLTGISMKIKAIYGKFYSEIEVIDKVLCATPIVKELSGVIEMVALNDDQ